MRASRSALFRSRHLRDAVIVLCLRWYLRYPPSYRNLEEMMAQRGLKLDHSIQHIRAPIEELKRSCELGRNCRCRRAPYLNILEKDHPFVKKRMISSQWFRSVDGALRTIAGYEAMNIVRKRQIRWLFSAADCALVCQPN